MTMPDYVPPGTPANVGAVANAAPSLTEEQMIAQYKAQLVQQNPALVYAIGGTPVGVGENPLSDPSNFATETPREKPAVSFLDGPLLDFEATKAEAKGMTQGALSNPAREALAREEAAAKGEADKQKGAATVEGASPEAKRDALLALLQRGQPRVLGYTKGGMQPNTTSQQAQVESKVLPPEWHEALKQFTAHQTSASEGRSIEQSLLLEAQQNAAARKSKMLAEHAAAEKQAQQQEVQARTAAEQRIQTALDDFKASGPRPENYGTFFENASPGGKVGAIFAGLFGAMGGAATGKPSGFTEALDKQIENRARAAEADQRRAGQVLGATESAYGRLERAFASEQAARAAVRSIYYEQAAEELKAEAAAIGVAAEHPRLQAMLAELDEKRLGYLKELASGVIETSRADMKYAPPRAIVSRGVGAADVFANLSKEQREQLSKYEEELEKRDIIKRETARDLMVQGAKEMAKENPDEGKRFLLKLAIANPANTGEVFAQFGSTPGSIKFANGYNLLLNARGGKALTGTELRTVAGGIGSGSDTDIQSGLYSVNREIQDEYDSLRSGGHDWAYKVHSLAREAFSSERAPRDVKGVPHPEQQTEPIPIETGTGHRVPK